MPNVLDRAQADAVQLGSRGGCVAHMRPVESSADQPHPLGVPGRDGGGAFALLHAGSPCDGTGAAGSRTRASAEARAAVGAAGRPSAGGPSRARLATAASRPPPPALRPHPGTWRFRPHRPQPPRRQRPISGARRLPHRPSPPRDSRLPAARGDVGRAIARSDGSLWGTRPLMCGSARVPGVSL